MNPVQAPPLQKVPVRQVRAGGQILNISASYWWPLYDIRTFTAATPMQRQMFFQQGQTAGRTWNDTNVPTAGKIPGGVVYSVHGHAVKIIADNSEINPIDFRLFQQGLFTFYIGDSARLRMPISVLGGMGGQSGMVGNAESYFNNGSFSTHDYWKNPNKSYDDAITSEQNFRVELSWGGGGFTPTDQFRIQVYLIGDYHTLVDRN